MIRSLFSSLWRRLSPADTASPDDLNAPSNRRDPYGLYMRLREANPVCQAHAGAPWTVSRWRDVEEVLGDPKRYSSAGIPHVETLLQGADDPEHARIRAIVSRIFAPREMESLAESLRELTSQRVAEFVDRGGGRFVAEVATPLPVEIIARILGLDPDRWRDYSRWSEAGAADSTVQRSGEDAASVSDTQSEMDDYIAEHVRRCRTGAVAGPFAEQVVSDLTDQEAADLIRVLLIAGNVTTRHLLSNIVVELAQRPDLFAEIRRDRSLIPGVVEETLRSNGPALAVYRRASEEVQLAGQTIPKNSRLAILLASANHCEERFEGADQFDPRRGGRHVGFGHGVHYCIGAPLSRLEARILLETLADACAALEFVGDPGSIDWDPHAQLRGPLSLRLRVTPAVPADGGDRAR